MKNEIWYNVRNGGDGSYYPNWFESKELAELDSEFPIYESDSELGEPCLGCITIISDTPSRAEEVITVKEVIKEMEEYIAEDKELYPNNDYPEQRSGYENRLREAKKLAELKKGLK